MLKLLHLSRQNSKPLKIYITKTQKMNPSSMRNSAIPAGG